MSCKHLGTLILFLSLFLTAEGNDRTLNRGLLLKSLRLGREFLVDNQLKAGNFRYEFDFRNGRQAGDDSPVRQAGALWGLASVHAALPSEKTSNALRRGFRFFITCSKPAEAGGYMVIYPGDDSGRTGTVALVTLALVDYLRTKPELPAAEKALYEKYLDHYVRFLLSLRTGRGLFHSEYDLDGRGIAGPSPYFDGETLLALMRVAKYAERDGLKRKLINSADAMYKRHVVAALKIHPDSPQTKGFYQWGSMAFYELYTSGWGPETQPYGKRILLMANWMISTHKVLTRQRNTAYAYEGLIHAYDIARRMRNKRVMAVLRRVIDEGLYRLSTWQVGSPIAISYITTKKEIDKRAKGGVLNDPEMANLRIDVTQHQMHAVALALRYVYRK